MNLKKLKTRELYTLLAAAKGLTIIEDAISNELNARVKMQREYAAWVATY